MPQHRRVRSVQSVFYTLGFPLCGLQHLNYCGTCGFNWNLNPHWLTLASFGIEGQDKQYLACMACPCATAPSCSCPGMSGLRVNHVRLQDTACVCHQAALFWVGGITTPTNGAGVDCADLWLLEASTCQPETLCRRWCADTDWLSCVLGDTLQNMCVTLAQPGLCECYGMKQNLWAFWQAAPVLSSYRLCKFACLGYYLTICWLFC
jgi:hypothetical protein